MDISYGLTDDAVLGELGRRLAGVRLERNWTQAQLAGQAGVSKRTIERLESGIVAAHLSALVRVCRALGLIDRLNALIPEPSPGPLAQLKLRGRTRRRASGRRMDAAAPKPWTWGEPS
jgi:transcriptional regulator with XRE-family HTH domain